MARIFITGSSDGLGLMAAKLLIDAGHAVVLHGRNDARRHDALNSAPGAESAVAGDLATIGGAKSVADQVNRLGRFHAVIHNAGIGYHIYHLLCGDAIGGAQGLRRPLAQAGSATA